MSHKNIAGVGLCSLTITKLPTCSDAAEKKFDV